MRDDVLYLPGDAKNRRSNYIDNNLFFHQGKEENDTNHILNT